MSRNGLATTLVLLLTSALSRSQTPALVGTIRGTVVNEDGNPIAGAKVSAIPVDVPLNGFQREVPSDGAGRFTLVNLQRGRYRVFTRKEADGYADTSWAIHDNGKVPIVEISATAPTVDVEVRIGPKAATLTGTITDAVTGRPVVDPRIRIWRWTDGVDRDTEFAATNIGSDYRFLIPPGKEVGVEFSASGYEPWSYCGESNGDKPFPLSLPSGAAKTLNIKLRPLPK